MSNTPNHVAIIMDGNGRWAKAKHLPRVAGHKKGADSIYEALEGCEETGVKYLTLYAFSSENWQRPETEIKDLMALLRHYLKKELKNLHKKGIAIKIIGDKSTLELDIIESINHAEELTKDNNKLTLVIAISYGSRQEIIQAIKQISNYNSTIEINEELISKNLYTKDIPDPDLIIRTSGEMRLSNFLLWQSAYSELYFTEILWPDFKKSDFIAAIKEFSKRERRYGTS